MSEGSGDNIEKQVDMQHNAEKLQCNTPLPWWDLAWFVWQCKVFLLTHQRCIRGSVRKLLGSSTMAACTESWGLNKNESGGAVWMPAERLRRLDLIWSVNPSTAHSCQYSALVWSGPSPPPAPQPQRHGPSSNRNDDYGPQANTQPSGHSKQYTNPREEPWRGWDVMERKERKGARNDKNQETEYTEKE